MSSDRLYSKRPQREIWPALSVLIRAGWEPNLGDALSGALPADDSGWIALLEMALRHRVAPLVYRGLIHTHAKTVPTEVREGFRQAYIETWARNLQLYKELQHLLEAFSMAQIPVIVLKGAVLAEVLYGDIALRPMADIDILIARSDLTQAKRTLLEQGYRFEIGPHNHSPEFAEAFMSQLSFGKDVPSGVQIDLHVDLITLSWFRPFTRIDLDALWTRALPIQLGQQPAWQLSLEDTLLHLCIHEALHHNGQHLLGYVDITRFIHRFGERLHWDVLVQQAHEYKIWHAVCISLSLARTLLNAPLPDTVLTELSLTTLRRKVILSLLRTETIVQSGTPLAGGSRMRWLPILLADHGKDFVRLFIHSLFPGRRWIRARYVVRDGIRVGLYSLFHPLRILGSTVLVFGRLIAGQIALILKHKGY